MQFKLRNRILKTDSIKGAVIRLVADSPGKTDVSVTTNSHGMATVDLKAIAPGSYTCTITAPQTSADPVGPALAGSGTVPDRIYRPVTLRCVRTMSGLGNFISNNLLYATIAASQSLISVDIQPVWMRSPANSKRDDAIGLIVVHHTACDRAHSVDVFISKRSPHYMIDTDGQIIKWVQEGRAAWHAGFSMWEDQPGVNSNSIGIEIVHTSGKYPEAQYAALIPLLQRLRASYPGIAAREIVGHSDVATKDKAHHQLGRKSGDPGATFEWTRLERNGLGLVPLVGPPSPGLYGGIFQAFPNGSLRRGDNDKSHRFGGTAHPKFEGTPVQDMQADLAAIGYSVGTPDGDFGERTHYAVLVFQEHFFAGGRGHKKPDGRVDLLTAGWLRSVAGGLAATATAP